MDQGLRKIRDLSFSDKFVFLTILSIVFLAHLPVLFPERLVNPDSAFVFPILLNIQGPLDYLNKLIHYETLDFQPIRDLSFFIDIFFFKNTSWLSVAFFNCIVWAGACYFILKIIREWITPRATDLIVVITFSVYPIFAQSVNWGIARKHLLAFLFTSWATYRLLVWIRTNKGEFFICFLYALSVLSLPVSLLWPLWALLFVRMIWPQRWSEFKKIAAILMVIMILATFINWSYYKTSLVFLENYPKKEGRGDLFVMLVSLGLYIKQMLFPYQLAFNYSYNHWALIGSAVFCLFMIWFFYRHRKNHRALVWLFFGFAHLAVLLSSPSFYYDPYVLMPSLSLLMLVLTLNENRPTRYLPYLLIPALAWGTITYISSLRWTDHFAFAQESFKQSPNCTMATSLATEYYTRGDKAPNDLYEYIQINNCTEIAPDTPQSMVLKTIGFESLQLYIEDDIDLEYRLKRMHELGMMNYTPMLFYASLLAKLDRKEEVEKAAVYLNYHLDKEDKKIEYHHIYSEVLPPYCRKNELVECNRLLKRFLPKEKDITDQ